MSLHKGEKPTVDGTIFLKLARALKQGWVEVTKPVLSKTKPETEKLSETVTV